MSWLKVSREITINADLDRVWALATFPEYTAARDPLFQLVAAEGTPSGTGSSYTVRTIEAAGTTNVVLHYEIIAASAPTHYRAMITLNNQVVQPQEGRFRREDDATVMTWTIDSDVPLFVKNKVKRSIDAALEKWLESVKALAESDFALPT
jgi:carbon monoxide dehydrogenase subunit G